jgi:integrase
VAGFLPFPRRRRGHASCSARRARQRVRQAGQAGRDALIEALTERRPPSGAGPDAICPDALVMTLVDQHLTRLAEDGRSPATLATYKFAADKLRMFLGGVRVREASTSRLDAALRSMRSAHGATMAKQAKTILRGGLQLAVMANVLSANPVRDVQPLPTKGRPKGAAALTADALRDLLTNVQASDYCRSHDLVDPITILAATGLRESELLGLQWNDFDATAGTLTVTGKVVRATGHGLARTDETKTAAGRRTLPLPQFAVDALNARHGRAFMGEQPMIFPSTAGTWRDPNNFNKQWRQARDGVGAAGVTTHSFREDGGHPDRWRRPVGTDRC